MAKCKWCENSRFFLSVNSNGLCKRCGMIINAEVQGKLRVMIDSESIITKSKKIGTILSRSQIINKYMIDLLKYENKGIEVFNVPIKESLLTSFEETDMKLMELVNKEYDICCDKIMKAKSKSVIQKHKLKYKELTDNVLSYIHNRNVDNEYLIDRLNDLNKKILKIYED